MWKLEQWYEKVVYVIGWIATILWSLAFLVVFIEGLVG